MHSTARPRPGPQKGLGGLKKKRRIQIVALAFVALLAATGLVGYALQDGINFFRSPTQVLAEGPPATEVFRLGGLVKPGSIQPGQGMEFRFVVTDGGAEIAVHYIGTSPRPDLFKEGTGTIATGTYAEGLFRATELLAKHDETYMPKEVMDALKEQGVYKAPEPGPAS